MKMEVCLTQAGVGDCILVRCEEKGKGVNILIDSGQSEQVFQKALNRVVQAKEKIELLVFTHDDNDHVKGASRLLERMYAKEQQASEREAAPKVCWGIKEDRMLFNFGGNGPEALLGAIDVKKLSEALEGVVDFHKLDFVLSDEPEDAKHPYPNMLQLRWGIAHSRSGSMLLRGLKEEDLRTECRHLELLILTPKRQALINYINHAWKKLNESDELLKAGKEENLKSQEWNRSIQYWLKHPMKLGDDAGYANHASISFLLFFGKSCALFAGDAAPDDMVEAGQEYLKRCGSSRNFMELAFIKLPHHGSSRNVNRRFLTFFRTKHYLVSTCGHAGYKHPGKGTLAEIASVLKPGGRAHIYSSYSWWRPDQSAEFCRAELWEGNWNQDGDLCRLIDCEGNSKELEFHKLGTVPFPIDIGITLSR